MHRSQRSRHSTREHKLWRAAGLRGWGFGRITAMALAGVDLEAQKREMDALKELEVQQEQGREVEVPAQPPAPATVPSGQL